MVEHSSAGAAELCAAARAVPDAYLKKGDATGYQQVLVSANIKCQSVMLDERYGIYRGLDGKPMPPTEPDDMSTLNNNVSLEGDAADAVANAN